MQDNLTRVDKPSPRPLPACRALPPTEAVGPSMRGRTAGEGGVKGNLTVVIGLVEPTRGTNKTRTTPSAPPLILQ